MPRSIASPAVPRAAGGVLALLLACACACDSSRHTTSPASAGAAFRGVGDLRGGTFRSEALAISDDGHVVVGRSSSEHSDEEGFVVADDDTLQPMLASGGIPAAGEPRALTPDGSIVAGKISIAGGPIQAARWTAASGWVGLGDLASGGFASQALGLSADGAIAVGWGSSDAGLEAARWVSAQPIPMGDLVGGLYNSAAALASDDGAVIVGTGSSALGPEVFVWREGTGMVGLGDLAGGEFSSEPFGMTPDASVIVGEGASDAGVEAFRWTEAGGFQGLGDLPGGAFHSTAFDVSADGAVVVGFATSANGQEAFIWDATHGMRSVREVLLAAGLAQLEGWTLTEATGIAADGHTVIGNGTNPGGSPRAGSPGCRDPGPAAGWPCRPA